MLKTTKNMWNFVKQSFEQVSLRDLWPIFIVSLTVYKSKYIFLYKFTFSEK